MTIVEAQQFVSRWRRILIPWHARTDAEAVRDMERSCLGVVGGMALAIGCATKLPSPWSVVIALIAITVLLFAFSLSLRFRSVRRLFDAAGPQLFAELKENDVCNPSSP